MKITIVQGPCFPVPALLGSALEKVQYALGRELAARGCEVTHISRAYPGLPDEEVSGGVYYKRIPGFDAPRSIQRMLLLDFIYSLRVKRVLPQGDILMTNTFWMPILARSRRHGALYVAVNRFPKGQMRLYQHADRLQAVSQAVADAIVMQAPACRSKVHVISSPLPGGWTEPAPDLAQPRRCEILYVGRVHPEKGIGLLLEAFARVVHSALQDWRLVIVGPAEAKMGGGGLDYLAQLKQQAEPIKAYVDWVGPVFDEAQLKNHYNQASIFVYPSLAEKGESFGLAPLEAMARGCVPVVSGLACFRDYLEPGKNGVVFDHKAADPAGALAERLSECVRSEEGLLPVRQYGVETAQHFTPVKIAEKFLTDFYCVLKNT